MRYQNVCLEAFGYTLPEQIVTSEEIEERLAPLYTRLRLPEGRLELMSGIGARRFWAPGVLPGEKSVESAERALANAGVSRHEIGVLIHSSVCRDYLEPATACGVHRALKLPQSCLIYDVSNACLGFLNGMIQIANMIELGQVRAGLVVGTECGRQLVENTIDRLNHDTSLSRRELKFAVASLTIGSASVAAVLVDRELSRTGNRLLAGAAYASTEHCELCRSGEDQATGGDQRPLMRTDSEALLREGVRAARECFPQFLASLDWRPENMDKTVCHQVGKAHRKAMFEALALDANRDFSTLEFLGNTGSAALPVTAAMAIEKGHIQPRDRVGLLGIGSGINVLMLGVEWQTSLVGNLPAGGVGVFNALSR